MRSRTIQNEYDAKLGRLETACGMYSMGRTTMKKVAEKAGAVVRVGTLYLIVFEKLDEYLEQLRQNQLNEGQMDERTTVCTDGHSDN